MGQVGQVRQVGQVGREDGTRTSLPRADFQGLGQTLGDPTSLVPAGRGTQLRGTSPRPVRVNSRPCSHKVLKIKTARCQFRDRRSQLLERGGQLTDGSVYTWGLAAQ